MIGVIARADEATIVEEFFELFKTPWEFCRPGRRYDVVVATADDIPDVETALLVLYSSGVRSVDARHGVAVRSRHQGGSLNYQGLALPIYGDLLTFEGENAGLLCTAAESEPAGLRIDSADGAVFRLGYDLFQEVRFLLTEGQPLKNAHVPTLDIHVKMLREFILSEGISLVEIPPVPAGHDFAVCLTHDIDFVGVRNHVCDHTMWGFLYRSTFGAIHNFFRRRISLVRLLKMWRAALSLPFVYLGWAKDFWEPFGWYLSVEKNLPATYFLIPFKGRAGEHVPGRGGTRRATAYDISDLPQWPATLMQEGCELGVHGIDSWHSVEKGREELARIAGVTSESRVGIRMHWLLRDPDTHAVLEKAGYDYDSSAGYNETVGYRNGTTQVFRPWGARTLLELPLHIQDGALFYPQRLDLSEPQAWERCAGLMDKAKELGGVLTLLWHDRSHGPERYWGDFYVRIVQALKSRDPWFGSAAQVVGWFRKRRTVRFEQIQAADGASHIHLCYEGEEIVPPLKVRWYGPDQGDNHPKPASKKTSACVEIGFNGRTSGDVERLLRSASAYTGTSLNTAAAADGQRSWESTGWPARPLQ